MPRINSHKMITALFFESVFAASSGLSLMFSVPERWNATGIGVVLFIVGSIGIAAAFALRGDGRRSRARTQKTQER